MVDSPYLVSIIMPAFNSRDTIKESIDSVLKQEYVNWELLITDDCSNDGTVEIIKNFEKQDARIKLFSNKVNSGAGVSRNNSIKKAKGRFIAFLDADDIWCFDKLSTQIPLMIENQIGLCYSGYKKFNELGEGADVIPPETTSYKALLRSNVVGCLTAIYDSEMIGKHYMPNIRKRQDMALWLQILKLNTKAYGVQKVLAKYRVGNGISQNKFEMAIWQWILYRDVLGLPLISSVFYMFTYFFLGAIKHVK